MNLYSKHNQVYITTHNDQQVVKKVFSSLEDWRREVEIYKLLHGGPPVPRFIECQAGSIIMCYLEFPTLLQTLEQQERCGFDEAPWRTLASWLSCCHRHCGYVPGDGNLRNFLWDSSKNQVFGIDFEHYRNETAQQSAARIIAYIYEYDPPGTAAKQQATHLLQELLAVPTADVTAQRNKLVVRRRANGNARRHPVCQE